MNRPNVTVAPFDNQIDCFGAYSSSSLICKKHCALRLSCAVMKAHNTQMELLEDLIDTDNMTTKIQ